MAQNLAHWTHRMSNFDKIWSDPFLADHSQQSFFDDNIKYLYKTLIVACLFLKFTEMVAKKAIIVPTFVTKVTE